MAVDILLGAWLLGVTPLQSSESPLRARLDWADDRVIRPGERVDIRLSRLLSATDGRIAVVIGDVDWTGLFVLDGQIFSYRGGPAPLPQGHSELTVFLVTAPNTWRQIASLTLHVVTGPGATQRKLTPSADLANLGQVVERHRPDSNTPARATFQDFTSHVGFRSEHVRNAISMRTQTTLLGASNQRQALRFGTAGLDAPQVDLSDYAWTVEGRRFSAALGNATFNMSRHLVTNFATRGVSATLRYQPVSFTVAAMNGQSIVGFDNFLGVSTSQNRVGLAVVGADLLPSRPGGARVEASLVGGEHLTPSGFTQGRVTDVLRSRGGGVRFVGSDRTRRLRLDTGFARSWSVNPTDPSLAQGFDIVAVHPRTSNADYVDLDYDVVKTGDAARRVPVLLTGTYRFERVDPFFTSVAAPQGVRSDLLQNVATVSAIVGKLTGQLSQTWSHDNLGRVASLLRTDSRLLTANVSAPTGTLGQSSRAAVWWPVVSYLLNRSSQVGQGVPDNGGFASVSQVPDQLNAVHTLRADWNFARWRIGYAVNRSLQDNRQPGREASDFETLVQQLAFTLTPAPRADIGLTIGRDRASNLEFQQESRTTRAGMTLNWQVGVHHALNAIVNRTQVRDVSAGPKDITDANLQYSYSFTFGSQGITRPRLQLFARGAWQSSDALNLFVGLPDNLRSWSLSSGATFTLF